uniref:LETM1 domain-containing protein n=1 Tax=Strongyloides venezuelensis TaxID=75913 RepID=A0A0K0F837_STRVS
MLLRNRLSLRYPLNTYSYRHQEVASSNNLALLSTSAHQLSSKKNLKEPKGILRKYENFRRFYTVYRQILDGFKWCVSDLKMYYMLRQTLRNNKKSIEDLKKEELECLIKTSSDLSKVLTLAVLAPLPLTIYPIILAIIFSPRQVLTHHFWSSQKYKEFFSKNIFSRSRFHYDSLLSMVKIYHQQSLPLKFCDINKEVVNIPSFDEMSVLEKYHLLRFHQVSLFNGIKKLKERSYLIHSLDDKLRKTLDISVYKMNEEEIIVQLYMRKIYFENTDDIEYLRKKLVEWLKHSEKFYIKGNEGFLLYAPIIEKGSTY